MKILMLGHSGVGKTTYMASMYGVLQTPVAGFSIRATRGDDHERLLKLYKEILLGKYPKPSNQRDSYPLRLRYHNEDVLSFDWADYRGGALVERASESAQARALHADLQSADAVLAFFDCSELANGNRCLAEIRRMIVLLSGAVESIGHPLPLGLVLAKADLVTELSNCKEPLQGLMESIRASNHIIASLIPIACGYQSYAVELPALFALHFGLTQRVRRLGEQVDAMAAERDKMRSNVDTFFDFAIDWIDSKLSDQSTWGELADAKHRDLLKEYDAMRALQSSADQLAKHLRKSNCRLFGGARAKGAGE